MLQQRFSSGQGRETVTSMAGLVEAIKHRQASKPRGSLTLTIGRDVFSVQLLVTGHLELDGQVPPLRMERDLELALNTVGAVLQASN